MIIKSENKLESGALNHKRSDGLPPRFNFVNELDSENEKQSDSMLFTAALMDQGKTQESQSKAVHFSNGERLTNIAGLDNEDSLINDSYFARMVAAKSHLDESSTLNAPDNLVRKKNSTKLIRVSKLTEDSDSKFEAGMVTTGVGGGARRGGVETGTKPSFIDGTFKTTDVSFN